MDVTMLATITFALVAPIVAAFAVALAVVLLGLLEQDVWSDFLADLGVEIAWGHYDPQEQLDGKYVDPMDAPPLAAVGCLAQPAPEGLVEAFCDVYVDIIEKLLLIEEQETMETSAEVEVELTQEEEDLILFMAYPVPAVIPAATYCDIEEQLRLLEAA